MGLLSVAVGAIGIVVGLNQVPSSATFAGGCTQLFASSGSCVIDEPSGENPATHGTATFAVVDSSLTFDFAPVEGVTAMVVCLVVNVGQLSPFIPTGPSSCTHDSSSKKYDGTYQDPYTYDLTTLAGWIPGQTVYFAIRFDQAGMTTYIVGGAATAATATTATTPSTVTAFTPTTVAVVATGVAPIPSTDGARDLGGLAPVGALLVVVGCKLLRITAGPTEP